MIRNDILSLGLKIGVGISSDILDIFDILKQYQTRMIFSIFSKISDWNDT